MDLFGNRFGNRHPCEDGNLDVAHCTDLLDSRLRGNDEYDGFRTSLMQNTTPKQFPAAIATLSTAKEQGVFPRR